jgi:two-component system cell cycle sensor histidine kinase/response regulator CckA
MQAVGQLAGGIAHDFNNLLTAMIGFCDLLLLRHRPGEQSFADIMHVKQSANRGANLVRHLLAFSRQQTLQPKVVNVTDVLGEQANLLRRVLGERVELKMVHGRDLGKVWVDEGELEHVIMNLAMNARHAMPEGGALSIRTAPLVLEKSLRRGTETVPPGEYVQIEVEDTGTGIPEDIIDRIFDPFFTTKEVGSGTGLGLSRVYGIVKQTGGFVFVDSKTGKGTTFRILLPRHEAERDAGAGAAEAAPAAELPADLTGVGTVLVVEDEDPVRLFAARALRNKGYRVLEAKSPESALELLEEQGSKIDLMITDVVMPRMDGPTLVARVRERIPNLRVLYISGYAEEAVTERIAVAGDAYFLPKPFSLAQLAARVKEVMLAGAAVDRALPKAKKSPRKAGKGGNAKRAKLAVEAGSDAEPGAEPDAEGAPDPQADKAVIRAVDSA